MYRVGFPCWKMAAKLGVPIRLRVYIKQDLEANVYVAQSPDLPGFVVEGQTLDEVNHEALICSKYLLEQTLKKAVPKTQTDFICQIVHSANA
jgi:predicted RNase H-like HicB family nuclease